VLTLLGHAVGWPMARGGSQRIADALCSYLRSLGGEVITSSPVDSIHDLPGARAILFDVTPRQLLRIAGDRLPQRYRRSLARYRYGPGACKLDWALEGPIPWRNEECARAMTVHVGGTYEEVLRSEAEMMAGRAPANPFVLVAQQSLADDTRAPAGRHTGWGYCHVPNGCTEDMTERIEAAVERFAPGFRDRILARRCRTPAQLEAYNAAMHGGDMAGGRNDLRQFLFRPAPRWDPYRTPNKRLFICSSSTPPGGGVHGMCGYHAARSALRSAFGIRDTAAGCS
ncbi:MAG: phytoene desaturase family protein, partial [Opitutaceae bacterium]